MIMGLLIPPIFLKTAPSLFTLFKFIPEAHSHKITLTNLTLFAKELQMVARKEFSDHSNFKKRSPCTARININVVLIVSSNRCLESTIDTHSV